MTETLTLEQINANRHRMGLSPLPQPELDRESFRAWLTSLPPRRRVLRRGQDLFERFLRVNGGGRRAGGGEDEAPGLFFYAYDLYPPEGTGAEMLAWWDAWCAEWDEETR